MYMSRLAIIYIILCLTNCRLAITLHITSTSFGQLRISSKKFQGHPASSPTLSKTIISDFIADLAAQVCLEDLQEIVAPLIA